MHYLTLVTAEIPALEADLQTDQEMAKHITALEQERIIRKGRLSYCLLHWKRATAAGIPSQEL